MTTVDGLNGTIKAAIEELQARVDVDVVPSGKYLKDDGTYDTPAGGGGSGTVTSVAALTLGTTGTDLSSSVANPTTTPVITLNVPTASATNRGALSSTDWSTFNGKQNALTNPVTGTGTTNELAYFTGASTIGSLATATYPSLTELSYVKGVTSAIQTQFTGKQDTLVSGTNIKTINSSSILGSGDLSITPTGAWLLASGGTLTGVNTITSNSPNQLLWNGTWTATANDQYHKQVSPSITARGTASDRLFAVNIAPTIIAGANTQTLAALQLNPTFTNGAFTGVSNYALWIRSGSLAGPNNATFTITSVVPDQAASSVAGNNLNLNASNATAGASVNSAAAGGNVNITAGVAARRNAINAVGGAINISGGYSAYQGKGGGINITGGVNEGVTGGFGGDVIIAGGGWAFSDQYPGAKLTLAGSGSTACGTATLEAGRANGTGTGGNTVVTSGYAGATGNTSGSTTLTSNSSAGSTGNTIVTTGTPNSGAYFSGSLLLSTANGGANSIGLPGASGAISITVGNGGAGTSGTGTGANAGAFSIVGGSGSSMASNSLAVTGGNGTSISITSGTGGNATGSAASRTGGNSGSITFATAAGGTGTSAGAVGSIFFKVNITTTLLELAFNSGVGKIGLFNATPVAQPTTAGASATRVGGGGTTLTDTDTFDGYTFAQIVKGLRNLGAFA